MQHRPIPHVTRLFVVDRSPLVTEQLRRDLASYPWIELVGASIGCAGTVERIVASGSQVLLLDAGIDSVARIIIDAQIAGHVAVIAATDDSNDGGKTAVTLLENGAVDLTTRPYDANAIPALARQIRSLANAVPFQQIPVDPVRSCDGIFAGATVAITAGPGGAMAVADVLAALPAELPGVVAIAPLPARALGEWIDRLNRRSIRRASVAVDGETITAGRILIAPGDSHLLIRSDAGRRLFVSVQNGPTVFHRRPSAELLFASLAKLATDLRTIAVMVGGAGVDGIGGLAAVRAAGGQTVLEATSTSSIPDATDFAVSAGVGDRIVPRSQIVTAIAELAANRPTLRAA